MSKAILEQAIKNAINKGFVTGYDTCLNDAVDTLATSALDDDAADLALDELDKLDHTRQVAYRANEYMGAVELPNVNQMEFQF
jgi:hypothetical protein